MWYRMLGGFLLMFTAWVRGGVAAEITGKVEDRQGRALTGADVFVQSESTGARRKTQADQTGRYLVSGLAPGRYKVMARMPGFRTVSRAGVAVDGVANLEIDFAMELLGLHEVITVTAGHDVMDPSGAPSLMLTRDSPGSVLPANGGDYRVLFDLMPGILMTPASMNDAGQFTSNGQRPNSNAFRVDGVSANTGVGSSILPGAFPGASLPAMTAIGSTENLASNETAQSVELRTSDFAPEFSARPGAQSLVNTRSGSNGYHGDVFGRLRDNAWNARDWFANSRALPFPRPHYSRTGFAFGGPIRRNRTFFFLSGETSELTDTGIQLVAVPSMETRPNAPPKLKQILSWYAAPTGPELGGGEAEGVYPHDVYARLYTASLRIDQTLGNRGNLFIRAVEAPSRTYNNHFNWASLTVGATAGRERAIHDLRFNYSRSDLTLSMFGAGFVYPDLVFGIAGMLPGYTVLPNGILFYAPVTSDLTSGLPVNAGRTILGLSVPGLGQFISYGSGSARQDQWELRETYSRVSGRHDLRAGIDYVRLSPNRDVGTYAVLGAASSLEDLLQEKPLAVTVSSPAQSGGAIHSISLFAQDAFRVRDRLSLLYGMSWFLTPPTSARLEIPTIAGLWTGSEWLGSHSGAINGSGRWPMRYFQLSPRLGVAYRLRDSKVVIRSGAGVFYDSTLGVSVNPINGAPFNSWMPTAGGMSGSTLSGVPGGMTSAQAAFSPEVARILRGEHPALRLPRSYQWRLSAEREMPFRGVASVAYLGALGKNLLGHQAYIDPDTGVLQRMVALTLNSSHYEALQVRYAGPFARSVYGSVSYTWSHSIDDGSEDSSVFLVYPGARLNDARGSSNFDVRHALTASLSYRSPRRRLPAFAQDWTFSAVLRARTGFPLDVLVNEQAMGRGFNNVGRPDRVPGAPLWVADPLAAGGRRLNRRAFSTPAPGSRQMLGRNSISGNGLTQLDASLRREFPIVRGLSLEVGVNVFNVLNHPTFADPVRFLSSAWFGQSVSMQNLMLGSGTPNTGLAPLFQTGGARSAEFSARISF